MVYTSANYIQKILMGDAYVTILVRPASQLPTQSAQRGLAKSDVGFQGDVFDS